MFPASVTGRVEVYTFWLYEVLALTTVMSMGIGILSAIIGSPVQGVALAVVLWLWLYGAVYLTTRARLRGFIDRAI